MRANIDSSKHYYTHTWWVQKLRRCNTRCQNSTTHIALFACMRACSTFCVYSFCLLEGIVLIDSPEDGYNRIHTDPPNNKMHKQFESFRQTTQHDTSFKFTGVMERQDKSHTQMPRPDHAVTCTNNCSCRTIEFKACKVLRAETHHCPMWPPPREMHFATRCCIRGTSLAAPGYLRAILGRAVLNLWKLAKLFARSCSSTQAHTFS